MNGHFWEGIIKVVIQMPHGCTYSSVSFLLSILTMTSLSSLAFSSLKDEARNDHLLVAEINKLTLSSTDL